MGSAFEIDATTGDLVRTTLAFVRVDGVDWQEQAIRSNLKMVLGEYFLDLEGVGLPYLRRRPGGFQILGAKAKDVQAIADLFRASILKLSFVSSVEDMSVTIDAVTRVMAVSFRIVNKDAVVIAGDFEVGA